MHKHLLLFLSIALAVTYLGACAVPQASVPTPVASPAPEVAPGVSEYDLELLR